MHNSERAEYDIAIVGGGIGGIYTAWRLLLADPTQSTKLAAWARARGGKLRVAVFEGSDRIGGRILSAQSPEAPHLTCEIGGMRYVSSQTLMASLIENELKLPRHEQAVDEPNNLVYVRGKHLRGADLDNPAVLPYNLRPAEQAWLKAGNPASNLMGWAVETLLPEVTKLSGAALEAYLQTASLDGVPLYQYGFWNLLAKAMGNEAWEVAKTTVGYDVLGLNHNAVDCIAEYFDFTPDVKYYLLDAGYEAVPWTLEQQVRRAGGEVHLNAWLESFDEATLADGSQGAELRFVGERAPVRARALVLAMPRRSLELLLQKGPVLDPTRAPHVRFLLNSVDPIDLDKMFVAYAEPWWEQQGVSKGRSLTDLPVRQCYYWGVEGQQPGADPTSTTALLMAYNDMLSSTFWAGLRDTALGDDDARRWVLPGGKPTAAVHPPTPLFVRRPTPAAAATAATPTDEWTSRLHRNWAAHPAPKKMVDEMHRQLMEMHGVTDAPAPLDAAFVDWSDDPYGGAVHFWNPGYKSWEVLETMTQPVETFPCYICGEAYSTRQTWAEGALQTAEIVLQKHFNLPAPTWVTPPAPSTPVSSGV